MAFKHILVGVDAATADPAHGPYGLIADAAIVVAEGRIKWVGRRTAVPAIAGAEIVNLDGRLLTPALIDCHTHLVYAGNRADEFEARLAGASYAEIAAGGGGIASTVRATRAASIEQLEAASAPRLKALVDEGVGLVEIKSGYGLELETEARQLTVARRLAARYGIEVVCTFLGLHALPLPSELGREAYVDAVCNDWLPKLHRRGLVDQVDAYCEHLAYTRTECDRLFAAAAALGIPVKAHAEQFSDLGASALVAQYHGLSVDHVEYLGADGIAALARSGTCAVLLPTAFATLKESRLPPIASLREAGVPMAVATDCNPGTSPSSSLRLAMHQACTLFGLTAEESFAAVTANAARALGAAGRRGQIARGQLAHLLAFDLGHPRELSYWLGGPGPMHLRYDRPLASGLAMAGRV